MKCTGSAHSYMSLSFPDICFTSLGPSGLFLARSLANWWLAYLLRFSPLTHIELSAPGNSTHQVGRVLAVDSR